MGFGTTAKKIDTAPVAEVKEHKGGPAFKIKVGGITCDGWKNAGEHADFYTYSLQRSYKQGNEWKNTNSLRAQDLPKAILALQKAYEKSFESEQDDKE